VSNPATLPVSIFVVLLQQDLIEHPPLLAVLTASLQASQCRTRSSLPVGIWQANLLPVNPEAPFLSATGQANERDWRVKISTLVNETLTTLAIWLPEAENDALEAVPLPVNACPVPADTVRAISTLLLVLPSIDGLTGPASRHILDAAALYWYRQHAGQVPVGFGAEIDESSLNHLTHWHPLAPYAHIWTVRVQTERQREPTKILVYWLAGTAAVAGSSTLSEPAHP
jgi:hypothetical protein